MNLNELTIKQVLSFINALQGGVQDTKDTKKHTMIGKKVIIRTYSAGCWFGELVEKDGTEVIIKNARRMYYWKALKGISLSACALYGVSTESKIIEPVESVWLDAIEIIPCSLESIKMMESADNVKAN